MQKINVLLLGILSAAVSLGFGSCSHSVPKHELCVIFENRLLCIGSDESEYDLEIEKAQDYLCTNSDDYVAVRDWIDKRITALETSCSCK